MDEKGTRYVERLGGSSRIIRATGLVCKSRGAANAAMHMPIGGETNLLLTSFLHGVGGSLGENKYIAPQGAYKENHMDKEERIKELREEIRSYRDELAERDNLYENNNPIYRMQHEIALLEQGCRVEQDTHGLLVNGRFIVSVRKNKWRVKGKSVWYRYKDIPTLVEKYINK